MSWEDKMILLRNYDLWADLTEEEYQDLNLLHNFITAPRGEYIYFEAFHHNKLYFVKDGLIRLGHIDEKGNEVIREIIRKGEVFGQVTLEKNNLNGEFAQAHRTDVSLCAFTIEDFQRILRKKPELALRYSRQVGSRLRTLENRLLNILHKDVRTRLIGLFQMLIQKHLPEATEGKYCLQNYLTHEDIAHLIGSSRQTVTTLFKELEEQDLIRYNRREICFPDVKKIQKLATVA